MTIVMKNRIKEILEEKNISILKLGTSIGMNYSSVHNLVNRESLGDTKIKTLMAVSKAINVELEELWIE